MHYIFLCFTTLFCFPFVSLGEEDLCKPEEKVLSPRTAVTAEFFCPTHSNLDSGSRVSISLRSPNCLSMNDTKQYQVCERPHGHCTQISCTNPIGSIRLLVGRSYHTIAIFDTDNDETVGGAPVLIVAQLVPTRWSTRLFRELAGNNNTNDTQQQNDTIAPTPTPPPIYTVICTVTAATSNTPQCPEIYERVQNGTMCSTLNLVQRFLEYCNLYLGGIVLQTGSLTQCSFAFGYYLGNPSCKYNTTVPPVTTLSPTPTPTPNITTPTPTPTLSPTPTPSKPPTPSPTKAYVCYPATTIVTSDNGCPDMFSVVHNKISCNVALNVKTQFKYYCEVYLGGVIMSYGNLRSCSGGGDYLETPLCSYYISRSPSPTPFPSSTPPPVASSPTPTPSRLPSAVPTPPPFNVSPIPTPTPSIPKFSPSATPTATPLRTPIPATTSTVQTSSQPSVTPTPTVKSTTTAPTPSQTVKVPVSPSTPTPAPGGGGSTNATDVGTYVLTFTLGASSSSWTSMQSTFLSKLSTAMGVPITSLQLTSSTTVDNTTTVIVTVANVSKVLLTSYTTNAAKLTPALNIIGVQLSDNAAMGDDGGSSDVGLETIAGATIGVAVVCGIVCFFTYRYVKKSVKAKGDAHRVTSEVPIDGVGPKDPKDFSNVKKQGGVSDGGAKGGEPPCSSCGGAATIKCSECELDYCEDCDIIVHRKKAFAKHEREPLNAPPSHFADLCQVCDEAPPTIVCLECGKSLCAECDKLTHKPAAKQKHKRVDVDPPPQPEEGGGGDPAGGMCSECGEAPATLQCPECGDKVFCSACDATVHKGKKKSKHERSTLPPPQDASQQLCGQCQEVVGAVVCSECEGLVYCEACDAAVHKGKKKKHVREPVGSEPSTGT